jgi:hypothetical protein
MQRSSEFQHCELGQCAASQWSSCGVFFDIDGDCGGRRLLSSISSFAGNALELATYWKFDANSRGGQSEPEKRLGEIGRTHTGIPPAPHRTVLGVIEVGGRPSFILST